MTERDFNAVIGRLYGDVCILENAIDNLFTLLRTTAEEATVMGSKGLEENLGLMYVHLMSIARDAEASAEDVNIAIRNERIVIDD